MTPTLDYQHLAEDYARHRQVNPDVVRRLVTPLCASDRVLEVGCGTGNYIHAVRALIGCECIGIDPSPAMLARAPSQGSRILLLPGGAEALEFEAHRFDLVFSVDVIHHVTDRAAAFHEAFRVLRPGGRVCTVTDSEWVIRNRVPLSAYFPETAEIDLGRYPCMGELRSTMSAAGYTEIREELAEWPYRLTDSRPYRAKAFSSLRLIDEDAYQAGLKRLEADLAEGPIRCASRYSLLWGRKTAGGGSRGGT